MDIVDIKILVTDSMSENDSEQELNKKESSLVKKHSNNKKEPEIRQNDFHL